MEEKIHPKYLKGFNQGYLLAKYKPQLMEQLTQNTHENEFIKGLKGGRQAFNKEKILNRLEELNLNKKFNINNNRDIEL